MLQQSSVRVYEKKTFRPFISGEFHSIFPGSFNPLHSTHLSIFDFIPNKSKAFELSINRCGKPAYTDEEINDILKQFDNVGPVILTDVPLMIDKLHIVNPNTVYLGMDNLLRLIQYYTLDAIAQWPHTLCVFSRIIDGKYIELSGQKSLARNIIYLENPGDPALSSTNIRNKK